MGTLFTEEELIHDYHLKKMKLEDQEDNIKRGEQIINQMFEQTSHDIFRMLQQAEEDVSEVYQFSYYRLNQLSEKYEERFQEEKRKIQLQLEEVEWEFKQNYNKLKIGD